MVNGGASAWNESKKESERGVSNTKGSKQEEGQIDDLLDEILQKNMEKEVQKREGRNQQEHAREIMREESRASQESLLPEKIIEETKNELEKDETREPSTEETTEFPQKNVEKKVKEDPVSEPSAYLNKVFLDEENSTDKDDIRVIEMAAGSDEDNRITKKDILSMLAYVCVIFLLTFVIVHYVGQRTRVSGSSMEDTLSDGDNLIVDKLSYRFDDPKRFDVIIFPFQYEEETYYIKRIIGLPGETVQIGGDGSIYINGELLEEDYGLETIRDPGMAVDPIVLGEDEYFVLGDNRNNSSDSRFGGVGKVHRDDIIGKAWIRIYPFNKIQKL